jgi:glycosyltransferase involved in cell wall biosynthesis
MGTPLLESISSGVPVVANADEPSFREWVIDDENGYLRPLNPDDWAEAIIKAAEFSQDQKLSMSEKIKQSISTVAIDQQYNRLLQAAAATRADQQINVEQVLSS